MKLLIIISFLFSTAYGQTKADTIKRIQQKQDSILIDAVTKDMRATLYGKIESAYYDALNEMIKEYIKQKSLQWNAKPK